MKRSRKGTTTARTAVAIEWVEVTAGAFLLGISEDVAEQMMARLQAAVVPKARLAYLRQLLYRAVPQQRLWLDSFYMSKYPITWAQYHHFAVSEHPFSDRNAFAAKRRDWVLSRSEQKGTTLAKHPAHVSWSAAMAFCDWIGARLPTSMEWEKGARGENGRLYPWGDSWDVSRGNLRRDRTRWPSKSSPVDAYPEGQSAYGLMDMAGNSYEWTLSTMIGMLSAGYEGEVVISRSCACDFNETSDEAMLPAWFRNLAVMTTQQPAFGGGSNLIGFRPVIDKWRQQAWAGF